MCSSDLKGFYNKIKNWPKLALKIGVRASSEFAEEFAGLIKKPTDLGFYNKIKIAFKTSAAPPKPAGAAPQRPSMVLTGRRTYPAMMP